MKNWFNRLFQKNQDIDIPHGTITRYANFGCRCTACTEATQPMSSGIDTHINPASGYKPIDFEEIVAEVAETKEVGVLTSTRWGKSSFGLSSQVK